MRNLIILTLLLIPLFGIAQVKAFPSAQGGASNITGGRGGTVIHVTNLNATGSGSLHAALTSTGTRTIVFDVSGTISIPNGISLGASNSNFTVAGQTAPEGGITITGNPIDFTLCNNMIWRYVRIRNAGITGESPDNIDDNGFWSNGVTGLMIDHCSFSFNNDQSISLNNKFAAVENITIQRNMFGENATNIIVGHNMSYSADNISFIANLYSNAPHRTPNIGSNGRVDIINQVQWNYVFRSVNLNAEGGNNTDLNYIGNYMGAGDNSGSIHNLRQTGTPSIYTAYNYEETLYPTPQLDDRNLWRDRGISTTSPPLLGSGYFTTTQHTLLLNTDTPMSAADAYTSVLADVGANRYLDNNGSPQTYLDSYDTQRINDVTTETSRNAFNKVWNLPTIPQNTRPGSFDTDNDGIADAFEVTQYGDLTQTATGDYDLDGYTNIESYFNQVDEPPPPPEPPGVSGIKPAKFVVGTGGGGAYFGSIKIKG